MAELVVAGALGAGAYWLMKTPVVNHREGVAAHAEDLVDVEGAFKPYGDLGDLNSQQSLAMQYDMENPQITNVTQGMAAFNVYMNTDQGQMEFQKFQSMFTPRLPPHKALKEFERRWRHKFHDQDEIAGRIKAVNKRSLMNAAVSTHNAFDPDRMITIRNRSTSRPLMAAFMGKNTRIGGHESWIDHSPYTLTDFESIHETPYASTRDGIHTDAEPFVDITPLVATMAPTRLLHHKGGALRMNYGEIKAQHRKAHAEPLDESAEEHIQRKRAKRPEYY